jgi:hypothetical protein
VTAVPHCSSATHPQTKLTASCLFLLVFLCSLPLSICNPQSHIASWYLYDERYFSCIGSRIVDRSQASPRADLAATDSVSYDSCTFQSMTTTFDWTRVTEIHAKCTLITDRWLRDECQSPPVPSPWPPLIANETINTYVPAVRAAYSMLSHAKEYGYRELLLLRNAPSRTVPSNTFPCPKLDSS